MNGATDSIGVRESFSELALWAGASLLVLSLHVGAAMWLLREPDMIAADDTPPAAIMIELAETPEATETEENEISPDEVMSDASAAAEKVEEPVDEPVLEQEVVQDEPEPVEEEPREEIAQLDKVEVPLPVAKPKPPEPKKEIVKKDEPKKKPVKQREQAGQAGSEGTGTGHAVQPQRSETVGFRFVCIFHDTGALAIAFDGASGAPQEISIGCQVASGRGHRLCSVSHR